MDQHRGFRPPLEVEGQRLTSAKHRRADNARLRAVPAADRLLTIVCRAGGRPTIFGVVVTHRDGHDHLMLGFRDGIGRGYLAPEAEEYLCRCGRAHPVIPARLWELVDHYRHLPPRRREVDVTRVG